MRAGGKIGASARPAVQARAASWRAFHGTRGRWKLRVSRKRQQAGLAPQRRHRVGRGGHLPPGAQAGVADSLCVKSVSKHAGRF